MNVSDNEREKMALALIRIMWRKKEINDSWYANTLRHCGSSVEEANIDESN